MKSWEINIDGLVGPTHNYSGLSYGNIASDKNRNLSSNPKKAALQGLKKMKQLHDLGIKQAVFPPQERPFLPILRTLGFTGIDRDVIEKAFKNYPELFFACCSASNMWMANAATVCASADSLDGKVNILPANLSSTLHRSIEHTSTTRLLQQTFEDPLYFVHHPILPAGHAFADEGAANHTRFCAPEGGPGVHLFVYGRQQLATQQNAPRRYPARQTLEASQAVARLMQLPEERTIFAQQTPEAIDAGVFHNDVIAVGHEHLFLFHEQAYVDQQKVLDEISYKVRSECSVDPILIEVLSNRIPLRTAVDTYLFNSQIVTLKDGIWMLLAPKECQEHRDVSQFLSEVVEDPSNPIASLSYIDLRESMRNGGGPACLRLRVVLNDAELAGMNSKFLLTDSLYERLVQWVNTHYRDYLLPSDLADIEFYNTNQKALNELYSLFF